MKQSLRQRIAVLASVSLVALGAAGGASAQEYVPFVTDFPAAAEPYRPFATDFGIPPRPAGGGFTLEARGAPAGPAPTGREWGDVVLGAGLGLAFAGLLAAGGLTVLAGRRRVVTR